jgi:Fur family transcriptional regulator, ferric uptake regulator
MVDLENTEAAAAARGAAADERPVSWRRTTQRAEVQRALIHSDGFVSAQALHAAMVAGGSRVGLTTVYRALSALAETGRADTVREPNGERLYRHRPGEEHRHYLICRSCGTSEPVDTAPVEIWAGHLAGKTGYADLHHTLELSGICGRCDTAAGPRG